jgi:hypothetical protein
VDKAVLADLSIRLSPERLNEGSLEERAAYGLFTIASGATHLTEGFDYYINGLRPGPLVSGYHVAEWFAWNWWRLTSEARSAAPDWVFAHSMSSIGEGYVWPNIRIFSDGFRTALLSAPSVRPDAKPFRYVGGRPIVVPSSAFEDALDVFIASIQTRLHDENVYNTNLDRLWRDILRERQDPELAKRRRLQALLGREPDDDNEAGIEQLVEDAKSLGESVIGELAADHAQRSARYAVMTADKLRSIAASTGFSASRRNSLHCVDQVATLGGQSDMPAWRLGANAASAVRAQENLGLEPVKTVSLAELAGISSTALVEEHWQDTDFSFALDVSANDARIVLRSRWLTGRRFDLARLLGDRLLANEDTLHPATRATTYRQKAQRSFAAELLSPFTAVDEMTAGDYSDERLQEIADYFEVSSLTVSAMLKNHGRIPRDVDDYAAAI